MAGNEQKKIKRVPQTKITYVYNIGAYALGNSLGMLQHRQSDGQSNLKQGPQMLLPRIDFHGHPKNTWQRDRVQFLTDVMTH